MHKMIQVGMLSLVASLAANATTFDFTSGGTNSGSGFGNVRTFTVGGLTVTATAWSLTGDAAGAPDTLFQNSQLGLFTGNGLGVCNRVEGTSCDSPNHQVDNVGSYDFVLFQFSSPVTLTSITIDPFAPTDADRDVSYWIGSAVTPLDLTNKSVANLAGLGFGGINNDSASASLSARTVTLSGTANSLLFGAQYGQGDLDDYFKITGMSTGSTTSAVPEPATFGLAGIALMGLGLARRKARKS